jgi:hypothetical protein
MAAPYKSLPSKDKYSTEPVDLFSPAQSYLSLKREREERVFLTKMYTNTVQKATESFGEYSRCADHNI